MLYGARVAVVVPAHDEARLIARTLRSIPAYVDHVVVVDDASRDETAQRVEALDDPRVELVRHLENRGVGAAIATGYRRAFGAGAQVAAVMAGDGQMDPRDLEALLTPVLRGEADYAKGDRLSHPDAFARMPVSRWLGNHGLSAATRVATGLAHPRLAVRIHGALAGRVRGALARSDVASLRLPERSPLAHGRGGPRGA